MPATKNNPTSMSDDTNHTEIEHFKQPTKLEVFKQLVTLHNSYASRSPTHCVFSCLSTNYMVSSQLEWTTPGLLTQTMP